MRGSADGRPDDDRLIELAREGVSEALELLVSRHQGVVYRFSLGLLADEEAAADVAQETFVRALTNLNGFRGDSTFRTWLLAIARNEAKASMRRRSRRTETPLDAVAPVADRAVSPEDRAVRSSEVARIREALDRLPEKQRLSVSLRLFDGLTFREIARATDSTEGSARVNYHHGIRRLREWLDEPEA